MMRITEESAFWSGGLIEKKFAFLPTKVVPLMLHPFQLPPKTIWLRSYYEVWTSPANRVRAVSRVVPERVLATEEVLQSWGITVPKWQRLKR